MSGKYLVFGTDLIFSWYGSHNQSFESFVIELENFTFSLCISFHYDIAKKMIFERTDNIMDIFVDEV
jgi:hypothetical protein